jgi:PAS domain S-box-containing protein
MGQLPLLHTQSLLESIIDSSIDGIFVVDRDFKFILWNKGMERITGKTQTDVLGRVSYIVFPFIEKLGTVEIYRQVLQGHIVQKSNRFYDVPDKAKSGYYDSTYSPVYGEDNKITGVLVVVHDITARYEAERALAASELQYRSLTEYAHNGILSFDSQGKIMSWNQGAEDIFEYRTDEIVGEFVGKIIPEELWRNYSRDIEAGFTRTELAKQGRSTEDFGTRKHGSSFPMDISLSAWKIDGQIFFSAFIRDISGDRHLEAIAEDQNDIYEALLQAQSDLGEGISILDANSQKIIYVNNAICEMYGYSREELLAIGDPLMFFAPEVRELAKKRIETRAMDIHWKSDRYESVHVRKDGVRFNVELSVAHCETAYGPSTISLIRDITVRKRNELALRDEELRFRALAEATFEGIAFAKDGVVIEVNESFCAVFGYSKPEVIGMVADQFVLPEDRHIVRGHIASNYEKLYQMRGVRKDGSVFFADVRGKSIQYRGETVRVTAIREIQERS